MKAYRILKINDIQLNIKKISSRIYKIFKPNKKRDFFYPEEKIKYLKSLNGKDRWPPHR